MFFQKLLSLACRRVQIQMYASCAPPNIDQKAAQLRRVQLDLYPRSPPAKRRLSRLYHTFHTWLKFLPFRPVHANLDELLYR